jgi:hypothetical protein
MSSSLWSWFVTVVRKYLKISKTLKGLLVCFYTADLIMTSSCDLAMRECRRIDLHSFLFVKVCFRPNVLLECFTVCVSFSTYFRPVNYHHSQSPEADLLLYLSSLRISLCLTLKPLSCTVISVGFSWHHYAMIICFSLHWSFRLPSIIYMHLLLCIFILNF